VGGMEMYSAVSTVDDSTYESPLKGYDMSGPGSTWPALADSYNKAN